MKKWKLLPKMAIKGIVTNGMVYYPYMVAVIFSVFTYFVFSVILHNDLMAILPYRAYAWVILEIGKFLLEIILFIFLFYAGSFIIKRRKAEIGLYNLLGLEKKHIGMMLFLETLILYVLTVTGGIVLGSVLSKLLFLILLRMSGISLNVEFIYAPQAFLETMKYFGIIFVFFFLCQLWEIGKSRPVELISGSKKGEKEPRFLVIWSAIGIIVLGIGYVKAITSQADSMILINFFLAILLVVIGTYFVFTSASVLFLKIMRRNTRLYYKPKNFITVSGMYYRMKKNAAGLVNICIFSTMILITLTCTVAMYLGLEEVTSYMVPYELEMDFEQTEGITEEEVLNKINELGEKYQLEIQRADFYEFIYLSCSIEGNAFSLKKENPYDERNTGVFIITLSDYEKLTGDREKLSENEILIHTEGADFNCEATSFMGIESRVRKEVQELYPYPKAQENRNGSYIIIVSDDKVRDEYVRTWAEQNGVEDMDSFLKSGSRRIGVLLDGTEEEKTALIEEFSVWGQAQPGFRSWKNGVEHRGELRSEYGGLLFIGVIFGFNFFLCLIIIMYYKQISEGYEDRRNYDIMQKVGMSEEEIKSAVHKQIFLVFGLPLFGALAHTFAGMFMVQKFMIVLAFYNTRLMTACEIGVIILFTFIYIHSYWKTAGTYYRIVNRIHL